MNKTMKMTLRLCALLCLVAGLSAFGLACGDDGGGGGNGSDCEDDELYATVGDETGCFTVCTGDAECGGGTCEQANEDTSICVGGSSNNNNGPDAGNNNNGPDTGNNNNGPDTGNNNTNPDTGNNNTNPDTGNNNTNPDTGNNSTLPSDQTCPEVLDCFGTCGQGDQGCLSDCIDSGTPEAQGQVDDLLTCAENNCPDGSEPGCVQEECGAEFDACADCASGEVAIGFECSTTCSTDGDCGSDERCTEGYFGIADQSVCAYHPESLADTCTADGDCGPADPDVAPGGFGVCADDTQGGGPDNTCYAVGCNPGAEGVDYGLQTGCGLEGLCLDQQGTGLCLHMCDEQSDCPRGDSADYSCRILAGGDNAWGICDLACGSDDDCVFDDGSGGEIQGRCNAKGYCETPCAGDGSCADAGGTCDSDDICVYE
jgi:hypothetical protein